MAFVCLTGTLAVLAHEIDWMMHPEMRVQPTPSRASWGDQLDAARKAYPGWEINRISAPTGARFASQLTAKTPEGRSRFIWVDPHRGTVTGDTAWFSAHRFLRNTHRHLMMPTKIGVPIVSALGIALLLTLATSLVIYRKWWKGLLAWPRGERPRRFWGDLHRLAGVWSMWFVLLIGLTSVWYLVESLGADAPSPRWQTMAKAEPVEQQIDGNAINRAVAQARQDWPRLEVTGVALNEARGVITLEGEADAVLVRERVNALRYAVNGRLLQRVDGTTLGLHQRISEMADPLHFGDFGGLLLKLVWFTFGALLTLLSLTGAYLYGLRAAASLRTARVPGATKPASIPLRAHLVWQRAWEGMKGWRWLWLGLIALSFFLLPKELQR